MPIMNMACSNAVECGFATVGTPDMWLLPFLLRATPRLDLTGWSLRSEVNHHSDRAFERHTRPDPERYETRNALAQDHLSGQSARVLRGLIAMMLAAASITVLGACDAAVQARSTNN